MNYENEEDLVDGELETPEEPEAPEVEEPTFEEILSEELETSRRAYFVDLRDLLYFAMDSRDIESVKFLLSEVEKEETRLLESGLVLPPTLITALGKSRGY